jgi:hypothetical protein
VASQLYKEHLFVARAQHNEIASCWIAEVTISWKVEGQYQFHRFNAAAALTEDEALAEAMLLAKLWVDRKL